jgi:hypothetical protein
MLVVAVELSEDVAVLVTVELPDEDSVSEADDEGVAVSDDVGGWLAVCSKHVRRSEHSTLR